jgi:hypothetical protein
MRLDETQLSTAQRFQIAKARSRRLLQKEWDEGKHPRVPAGGPDGGQFGEGGGGATSTAKPKGKKKVKREDFEKADVELSMISSNIEPFIDKWNDKVGEDPAEFKKSFMGGLDGTMKLSGSGSAIEITGSIRTDAGTAVGSFAREIDLDNKVAKSAYFALDKSTRGSDIGKNLLAGNVETYRELGVEKVKVFANIDVGGYAWAKYGYVPEAAAWAELRRGLERKLTGESSSSSSARDNVIEADDWDMLTSDVQSDVRDRWMRESHDEFLRSEEQNWRDSGQAKDDAKRELADEFTNDQVSTADVPAWVNEALDGARQYREDKGQPPIPYTNRQLYDAVELTFDSRRGDGEDDPDIGFDDNMLKEPVGYDPSQGTLPGIEPEDPSQRLTEDMRKRIEKRLIAAFDKEAEDKASRIDAPSYLADSVSEYQDEYWDSMDDSERLRHARDYGMADIAIEPPEEPEQLELPKAEADPLLAAVRSSDPKSIWKIADSARGKELLLGKSWDGVLDLKDKESMKRFDQYVGRRQHAA